MIHLLDYLSVSDNCKELFIVVVVVVVVVAVVVVVVVTTALLADWVFLSPHSVRNRSSTIFHTKLCLCFQLHAARKNCYVIYRWDNGSTSPILLIHILQYP